ncbi:MAG TPA: hypothetical protein H9716_04695 [Candidatus Enterocloster faecavium]|uniref:Uncharacterized protein n=1 Tax=Candidatus Enterocloster faecavium TaxID=2838560 RepID=A0A9D2RK91_9FIRM|nr:hypothetical protein [Candidatus Enterocloster faecavium]
MSAGKRSPRTNPASFSCILISRKALKTGKSAYHRTENSRRSIEKWTAKNPPHNQKPPLKYENPGTICRLPAPQTAYNKAEFQKGLFRLTGPFRYLPGVF